MRRRALLAALATGSPAGAAGCLGGPQSSVPAEAETDRAANSPAPRTSTPAPPSTATLPGPVRCRGDPIPAERSVTDEPGYGDDLEYYPSNATVRFVSARRGDEPAAYDAMPFEQWASIECAEVSLERTRAVTAERLGTDEFGSGMGRPPEPFAADGLVVRLHVATVVEDGERAATPTVDLSTLADAAPAHVSATVSLEGEEFSREVPVFADHVTIGFG